MSATRKITVELPEPLARQMEAKVSSGAYAGIDDLVADSLYAQLAEEDRLGAWIGGELREAVAEWRASPNDVTPAEQVFGGVLDRYEARKAKRG